MHKKFKAITLSLGLSITAIFLCGCSEKEVVDNADEVEIVIEDEIEKEESMVEEEPIAPSKELVLQKREEALVGMSEDDIKHFREYIKTSNLAFEHAKLYGNLLERLSDPADISWNYFEETGYIQTGWGFDEGVEYDESLGITYEEFLDEYGDPVMAYNDYDGDDFIDTIQKIKDKLESDLLYSDLDNLIEYMELAIETHNVEYINNVYHILHDMDYFFLRYSPEDVAPHVSDVSTIAKYYGVLELYK